MEPRPIPSSRGDTTRGNVCERGGTVAPSLHRYRRRQRTNKRIESPHINGMARPPYELETVQPFSVSKDLLRVDVTCTDDIRAHFRGRSVLRDPEVLLVPLFDNLAAGAIKTHFPVQLHFEELEFFNSSTISCIMQCIIGIRDKGVRTVIRYNSRQKWQKVFFDALSMMRGSGGLLEVQSV